MTQKAKPADTDKVWRAIEITSTASGWYWKHPEKKTSGLPLWNGPYETKQEALNDAALEGFSA